MFSYSPNIVPVLNLSFSPLLHKLLEMLLTIVFFGVFFHTNNLFSKSKDKRMAIIAGGFLSAGLLNMYHMFAAVDFSYDIFNLRNLQSDSSLFYLLVEKLIISITLFISVFYRQTEKVSANFRIKAYAIYFIIIMASVIFGNMVLPQVFAHRFTRFFIFEESLAIIDIAFYILTALIYADTRLINRKSLVSPFIVGLILFAVGQMFFISLSIIPFYAIIAHLFKIAGAAFILLGIKDIEFISNVMSLRQRLLATLSSFLIFSFIIFASLSSSIIKITLPSYSKFMFLDFLLVFAWVKYLFATRLTTPVSNIIDVMNRYAPEREPETIPVISNDEIGVLTGKINDITEQNWEYIHTLKEREALIKQSRDRERILKEITNELKLSRSLDQAYNYILAKLADVFDVDRTLFIELPNAYKAKPFTKYEYLRAKSLASLKGVEYSHTTVDDFYEMLNEPEHLNIIVIDDCEKRHKNNVLAQDFLKKYDVESMMVTLLVRYNHGIRILGSLAVCSSTKRCWTEEEKELLRAISDSIVGVIWEITRIIEIDEIRNTFILTLAHDFQVPLIGERRALEYVISRRPDEPIGKFRDFIEETISSNYNLTRMLTKLLDIYRYELKKKELSFSKVNTSSLIKEITENLKDFVQLKNLSIVVDLQDDLPDITADRNEILRVIETVLINAVEHSRKNTSVTVKAYRENSSVTISINDMGDGIPLDVREKIFDRYPMVQAIERKIGAGLGLYLAKLTVSAHKGRIWFDTEIDKGTTFYFTLPINQE